MPKHKEGFQAHIEKSHANLMSGLNWKAPSDASSKPVVRQLEGGDGRTIKKPLHRQPLENQQHARLNMIRKAAAKFAKAKA